MIIMNNNNNNFIMYTFYSQASQKPFILLVLVLFQTVQTHIRGLLYILNFLIEYFEEHNKVIH